ncbi:hypothetical protein HDV01_007507 [Terramyces sp. JEL0728]|nr:hypothetical protein HDV01_007507 [Terramyces sp. JEL0728]
MFFRMRNEEVSDYPASLNNLFVEFQEERSTIIFPKMILFLNNYLRFNPYLPLSKHLELLICKNSNLLEFTKGNLVERVNRVTTLHKLSEEDVDIFATAIYRMKKLEELYLQIQPTITVAGKLSEGLVNSCITKLSLCMCDLNDQFISIFAICLPQSRIQYLNLAHNKIRNFGASSLARALEAGCPLNTLILNGNQIGSGGIADISRALPKANLQSLSIMYNGLLKPDLNLLFEQLPNCKLERIQYDTRFAAVVAADPLIQNVEFSQLKELTISVGTEALGDLLEKLERSKVVDLSFGNHPRIDSTFISTLSLRLKYTNLQRLVMPYATFDEETFATFLRAVTQCPSLVHLTLDDCMSLGDSRMGILASRLVDTFLTSLSIGGCGFSRKGLMNLVKVIAQSKLKKLVVKKCRIPAAEMQRLLEIYATSSLNYLDVSNNSEYVDPQLLKYYKRQYSRKTLIY